MLVDDPALAMTPLFAGVACPTITPLDGGAVDVASLRSHIKWLLDAGVDGRVPCGTTGEFASLTDEERATVVETTVTAADGRVPVVAGAADTTVPGAAGRVDRAVAAGARAAIVPPPYYHGGSDPLVKMSDGVYPQIHSAHLANERV